jgi:hypothetical protein
MTNLPEEILEGCLKENKSVVEKLSGLGAEDFEKIKLLGKGDVGRGLEFLYLKQSLFGSSQRH